MNRRIICLLAIGAASLAAPACQFNDGDEGTFGSEDESPTESPGGSSGTDSETTGGADECSPDTVRERLLEFNDERMPVPAMCTQAPSGTFTATVRSRYNYGQSRGAPDSVSVTFAGGGVASVNGVACEPMFPGELSHTVDPEECSQYFVCGCCAYELAVGGTLDVTETLPDTAHWSLAAHPTYCQTALSGNEYYVGGHPGDKPAPTGGGSSGTGGSSGGGSCGAYRSCQVCYQSCDDRCYDYPMGCLGPCFQACDRCCTP